MGVVFLDSKEGTYYPKGFFRTDFAFRNIHEARFQYYPTPSNTMM